MRTLSSQPSGERVHDACAPERPKEFVLPRAEGLRARHVYTTVQRRSRNGMHAALPQRASRDGARTVEWWDGAGARVPRKHHAVLLLQVARGSRAAAGERERRMRAATRVCVGGGVDETRSDRCPVARAGGMFPVAHPTSGRLRTSLHYGNSPVRRPHFLCEIPRDARRRVDMLSTWPGTNPSCLSLTTMMTSARCLRRH